LFIPLSAFKNKAVSLDLDCDQKCEVTYFV